MKKVCSKCLKEKDTIEFTRRSGRQGVKGFLRSYCKDCRHERETLRHLDDPIGHLQRTRNGINRNPSRYLYTKVREKAVRDGVPFNLSVDDIVVPTVCPVYGIPLFRGIGKATDNSPSVDKIIPSLGYVKGNVCVISLKANRHKNDATLEELRLLVEYVESFLRKEGPASS